MADAGSSGSKRRARQDDEVDVEASLHELTGRLSAATTSDFDSLVALLVDVLNIEASTAAFYLDACNNDPHGAAALHMQRQRQPADTHCKRSRPDPLIVQSNVEIAGLPQGWSARVSNAGTIVFQHEDGQEQATVPPGFPRATGAAKVDRMSDDAVDDTPTLPSDPLRLTPTEHPHVVCDGCDQPLSGIRYRSLTRDNFDLCDACMWSGMHVERAVAGSGGGLAGHWMRMSYVVA